FTPLHHPARMQFEKQTPRAITMPWRSAKEKRFMNSESLTASSKRLLGLLVLASWTLLLSFPMATPAAAQATSVVTLLHISDTHSHLAAWGPKQYELPDYTQPQWVWDEELHRWVKGNLLDGTLGGLPKAASIVAYEKAQNNQAIFVHAGDIMDGDFFFDEHLGAAELQLLKSVGLDAMTLGNHDFRLGPDFLASVLNSAWPSNPVPILGTNLDTSTSTLNPWIVRTTLKEVNGVKLGFFGLTLPNGALANPKPVKVLPYLSTVAPEAVSLLRASGAQVVVCLAHIGMAASRELAINVPGIDVIVNGHDNAVLAQPEQVPYPGGTTLIVSAGNHYRWVGRLRLAVNRNQIRLLDYDLLSADAATPVLPSVQTKIKHLQTDIVARYGNVYDEQLALASRDITPAWTANSQRRDTALGDFFADAYRARTGTDIALEAIGFLGDAIPRGPVVGADILRAMSYGTPALVSEQQIVSPWRLITLRTPGAAVLAALNTTVTLGGDYFPQTSGMKFDYNSTLKGQKILPQTVLVGGNVIVPTQMYSVTVTEGVYAALKSLRLPMEDVQVRKDTAFDAARAYARTVWRLDEPASLRIRDLASPD
ncbi:MAG TPA: bifunctional UDP-sugar hydrolase/5'-nucleotidase, partial [Terriglobales bacterium]|nr:bifunctional UDP-sugar hydrolase/5'-nucleotidase [Terriglobales bacterium]